MRCETRKPLERFCYKVNFESNFASSSEIKYAKLYIGGNKHIVCNVCEHCMHLYSENIEINFRCCYVLEMISI